MWGKQYVGSTTERFRFWWNNYKSCQRRAEREREEDCIQRYLHEHFLSKGHNGLINDIEIIFIDKTDPSDPARREEFWRTKLKTFAPYSLNVEEWLLMSSLWWLLVCTFQLSCHVLCHIMSFLKMFCFCKTLKNRDNVCNLKPFAQIHLSFRFLICCCLWTIGFLVI